MILVGEHRVPPIIQGKLGLPTTIASLYARFGPPVDIISPIRTFTSNSESSHQAPLPPVARLILLASTPF